ncbi:MAG: NAD(P)-dependent oxidoreductase [Chitinophagales bacterium]|nr:MAG: NAD(P)-dependent oxidoreductase [Chitinophagales bacterium]
MANILITGATGHLGSATIDYLIRKGFPPHQLRALARNENKAAELKRKGVRLVIADYNDYNSLVSAFKEAEKVFFISASDIPQRTRQHENVAKALKEAGVKHVVYTSFVRKTEGSSSPIAVVAEAHWKTEHWLKELDIPHTILRNNLYMDYIPFFIGDKVLETGMIYFPAGEGKAAVALRSEMAEAAASILMAEKTEKQVYNFSNVVSYAMTDVALAIEKASGKPIRYVSPSIDEYRKALKEAQVPEQYIELNIGFAHAIAQGEFDTPANDLETLLGRKPVSLEEFYKTLLSQKK